MEEEKKREGEKPEMRGKRNIRGDEKHTHIVHVFPCHRCLPLHSYASTPLPPSFASSHATHTFSHTFISLPRPTLPLPCLHRAFLDVAFPQHHFLTSSHALTATSFLATGHSHLIPRLQLLRRLHPASPCAISTSMHAQVNRPKTSLQISGPVDRTLRRPALHLPSQPPPHHPLLPASVRRCLHPATISTLTAFFPPILLAISYPGLPSPSLHPGFPSSPCATPLPRLPFPSCSPTFAQPSTRSPADFLAPTLPIIQPRHCPSTAH